MSRTRRGLLAEWPFRWMWTAESVSKLGDSVTVLALPLLAIITLEATPLQVGIIGATQFIPMLAFGLYAGVWVDRHRPRQVMIVADVVRGVALATVPLAFFIGRVTLTHLLVVAFVHATASTFGDVAIASYVPRLVGIDRVVEANSRLELSRSAVQVLGFPTWPD
jgi:MFS family permease